MTFAQLKIECVNRRIDITGTKSDIVKRLLEHDQSKAVAAGAAVGVTGVAKKTDNRTVSVQCVGKRRDLQRCIDCFHLLYLAIDLRRMVLCMPVAEKPVMRTSKFCQVKPSMVSRILQSDSIVIDDPKPRQLRDFFSDETVRYPGACMMSRKPILFNYEGRVTQFLSSTFRIAQ